MLQESPVSHKSQNGYNTGEGSKHLTLCSLSLVVCGEQEAQKRLCVSLRHGGNSVDTESNVCCGEPGHSHLLYILFAAIMSAAWVVNTFLFQK